jgi:hypothetical protein
MNDHVSDFEKAFSALFEKYKTEIVPEALQDERMPNAPLSEGFRVGPSYKWYASIRPGMLKRAIAWFEPRNMLDLVTESVNAQSLSSSMGNKIKETSEEPPRDIFSITLKPSTKVTAVRAKGATTIEGDD